MKINITDEELDAWYDQTVANYTRDGLPVVEDPSKRRLEVTHKDGTRWEVLFEGESALPGTRVRRLDDRRTSYIANAARLKKNKH